MKSCFPLTTLQRNFYCKVQSTDLLPTHAQTFTRAHTHTHTHTQCPVLVDNYLPHSQDLHLAEPRRGLWCLGSTRLSLSRTHRAFINWLSVCVSVCAHVKALFCAIAGLFGVFIYLFKKKRIKNPLGWGAAFEDAHRCVSLNVCKLAA